MPIIVAYNATDGPVPVDGDGRTIDGATWSAVDDDEEAVRAAAEAGRLHLFRDLDEGPGQSDAAVAAIRAARDGEAARLERVAQEGQAKAAGYAATDAEVAAMNVDEAAAYVGLHPDEFDRVLELERARPTPRKGVLELHDPNQPLEEVPAR